MKSIEENGAYEVIKGRLIKQGTDLKERIEKLNDVRKEAFGSIETELIGNERVITDHNCVPRDMAPVDDLFIFGYNVLIGLKSKVELSDVFAIYKFQDNMDTIFSMEDIVMFNDVTINTKYF